MIVVSEIVTLDGVIQDGTGDEGFARGGWAGRAGPRGREQTAKILLDDALGSDALHWADAPTSCSPRDGHPGPESWPTG
jgi:hypothetical protein